MAEPAVRWTSGVTVFRHCSTTQELARRDGRYHVGVSELASVLLIGKVITMPLRRISAISIAVACLITPAAPAPAQAQDYLRGLSPESIANLIASAQPDTPVPLTVANRTITELRAGILGRSSTDRAAAAAALITTIAADGQRHVATSRELATAAVISIDGRDVFAIMPADANELVSESVTSKAAAAVTRLQLALDELAESRRPQLLLWGGVQAVAVPVLFGFVVLVR